MPKKAPRQNKTKEAIEKEMRNKQYIARQKSLAKIIFSIIANLSTVYDAQTAVNAVAGFLQDEMSKREAELNVCDLLVDLSSQKESEVLTAVKSIFDKLQTENAKESVTILEIMGQKLPQFLANKHLKDPMNSITAEDFIV